MIEHVIRLIYPFQLRSIFRFLCMLNHSLTNQWLKNVGRWVTIISHCVGNPGQALESSSLVVYKLRAYTCSTSFATTIIPSSILWRHLSSINVIMETTTNAINVKTFLEQQTTSSGQRTEIRRFVLDQDVSTSFEYLTNKIASIYPDLALNNFRVFWKGMSSSK